MPVITISRQFGAGGKTLTDQLAARLGCGVANEEIIDKLLMKLFNSADYDQPVHYDLVLNMSKLNIDRAVDLICTLVER
jgi:cytidylate kinase